jgi:hypothetical protein
MRGLVLSLTVALGWRSFWRGRRSRDKDGVSEVDPAEELRLKLAARKASPGPAVEEVPQAVAADSGNLGDDHSVVTVESPLADPDKRRQDVHERARGAIDELR